MSTSTNSVRTIGKSLLIAFFILVLAAWGSGAFSDDLKLQSVFKHLNYKGFSSTDKAYYEETTPFSPFVHGDNVWLDDITNFAASNTSGRVVEHYRATFSEDVTVSNARAWFNTTISGDCVPPSYNQSYTVKLYESDGTQIFLSDASDPFFEYETCRLAFQDTHSFSEPILVTVYTYAGSSLGNGSSLGGGSDTQWGLGTGFQNKSNSIYPTSYWNDTFVNEGDDQDSDTIWGLSVWFSNKTNILYPSSLWNTTYALKEAYFSDISNFTGTLTDAKICTYDSGNGEIHCEYNETFWSFADEFDQNLNVSSDVQFNSIDIVSPPSACSNANYFVTLWNGSTQTCTEIDYENFPNLNVSGSINMTGEDIIGVNCVNFTTGGAICGVE